MPEPTEPTPQVSDAWAVCSERTGIILHTIARTRRGAIFALTEGCRGVSCMKEWRKLKREYGLRASRVQVQEYLFKTN